MGDEARYKFGYLQKVSSIVSEEIKRKELGSKCVNCGKRADGQSFYCSAACNKKYLYRKKNGIKWEN